MLLTRGGFVGSAMRAMVAGALRAIRRTVSARVLSKIAPATALLSSHAPANEPRDAATVLRAARELLERLLPCFALQR